ncbi:MAG: hypothetical protein JXB05_16565 [Myxococcaceae bacterium]|nr:hypothetical protein [Myxococcaceae bacterium]
MALLLRRRFAVALALALLMPAALEAELEFGVPIAGWLVSAQQSHGVARILAREVYSQGLSGLSTAQRGVLGHAHHLRHILDARVLEAPDRAGAEVDDALVPRIRRGEQAGGLVEEHQPSFRPTPLTRFVDAPLALLRHFSLTRTRRVQSP